MNYNKKGQPWNIFYVNWIKWPFWWRYHSQYPVLQVCVCVWERKKSSLCMFNYNYSFKKVKLSLPCSSSSSNNDDGDHNNNLKTNLPICPLCTGRPGMEDHLCGFSWERGVRPGFGLCFSGPCTSWQTHVCVSGESSQWAFIM